MGSKPLPVTECGLRALSLYQERNGQGSALTLLSLSGKKVGMDYVCAGLALSDLRRGTDMTLEGYLLTMEQW